MTGEGYTYSVDRLEGGKLELGACTGKVLLIVNTASQCGFTPQYAGLERLWLDYRERGLVVVGFPCNQFGDQEPGSSQEIGAFCQKNFGVTFPLAAKIDVNGPDAHPLFKYLAEKAPGLLGSKAIKWNFTKFLVDRGGNVVSRFAPTTKPEELVPEIERLLAQE
jgi:glutathione peroxidase